MDSPAIPSILAAVLLATPLVAAPAPQADTTRMHFAPASPDPGDHVEVRYQPNADLANENVLRLRTRFRTARDGPYDDGAQQVEASLLTRATDGTFRGSFTFDPSSVYAAFAVEDTSGRRVDHNDRRLWDLMVAGPDGRPLEAALVQTSNDLMGRNWQAAHKAAQIRRDLYPESPAAWSDLHFFQSQVFPPDSMARALADHRLRLAELDSALRDDPDVDPEVIANMMWYARSLKDSTVEARWQGRLLSEAPTETHALQERIVYDVLPAHREDPQGRLAALEAIWREADPDADEITGPGYSHLLRFGLQTARELGDERAERRWIERYRLSGQNVRLGPDTSERVRTEIAALTSDLHARRPLTMPIQDWQRRMEAPLQRAFGRLGDVLLAAGDSAAALKAYDQAVAREAWDVQLLHRLADLYSELGREHEAAELFARVAVDPAADVPLDSLRKRGVEAVGEAEWTDLVSSARQRLRDLVLKGAVDRALPADPTLADAGGGWATLSSLSTGRPTLVVFWSRFCGPSVQALPELKELARDLAAEGVRTVAITEEPPSAEFASFLEEHELADLPVRHDLRREASRAFNQWATPSYFLLDGDGRLRFEYSTLTDLRRQVGTLDRPLSHRPTGDRQP